jgi:hypothetical protein
MDSKNPLRIVRPGHEARIELFVTRYQVVDGWMDGGGGGQVMTASGEENEVENESRVMKLISIKV